MFAVIIESYQNGQRVASEQIAEFETELQANEHIEKQIDMYGEDKNVRYWVEAL